MSAITMTKRPATTKAVATPAACIDVIDPMNRTGKITVPMQYVQDTRGVSESRPRDAKDMSLCLLFQKGRCNAGARCHQVHVDVSFVNKLRAQASAGSACCALHGDFHSANLLSMANQSVEVMTNGTATSYPIIAFGRTSALDTIIAAAANSGKTIRVNANKICRLHSQGKCKFGKDCKNIHMCPNAKPSSPIPAPLSAPRKINKSAVTLDVSKSELELSSTCGLSTVCGTPERESLASSMRSSFASSPSESPKEYGLFNRVPSVPSSPAPVPVTPPQKPSSAVKKAPAPIHPAAVEPLSFFAGTDSIWADKPVTREAPVEVDPIMSQIAADLAQLTCSPIASPSWTL